VTKILGRQQLTSAANVNRTDNPVFVAARLAKNPHYAQDHTSSQSMQVGQAIGMEELSDSVNSISEGNYVLAQELRVMLHR